MRKLPCKYENQIDNVLYKIIPNATDFLYNIGFTPNGVTTLSTLCGIASIYNITHKNYIIASLFYLLFYWFDCVDGYMARRYNMVTEFGDSYDHFKDMIVMLIVVYHIIMSNINNIGIKIGIIILIAIIAFGTLVQLSCQETYIKTHNVMGEELSDTLSDITLCPATNPDDATSHLAYSRFAGCGSLTMAICLVLIFVGIAERNNY